MSPKNAKPRKIPLRRCTGCGESFPKKDLIRIVRSPEGTVSLDFTGKAGGRGAYICKKAACFRKARKQNRIKSALEVEIPESVLQALEEEIELCEKEESEKDEH